MKRSCGWNTVQCSEFDRNRLNLSEVKQSEVEQCTEQKKSAAEPTAVQNAKLNDTKVVLCAEAG